MSQFQLPIAPRFPPRPVGTPAWAQQMEDSVRDLYRILANRLESVITVGPIASRPTADGTFRFYFADDEAPPVLYFDDGAWNAVNAT